MIGRARVTAWHLRAPKDAPQILRQRHACRYRGRRSDVQGSQLRMLSGLPHQEDRSQRGCGYRKYRRYWPWKRPLVAPELGISRAEADVLADVFRGGPPCPLVFSLSTCNVSTRRKLYAKAGWRGRVSRPKATKCYSLTAWQLTFLLYASDQQYIEAPKGSLLGCDREGQRVISRKRLDAIVNYVW